MNSRRVIDCTIVPWVALLGAIGVATAMAFAQLWPGSPDTLDRNESVTVGTFQEILPMSSVYPAARSLSRTRALTQLVLWMKLFTGGR